MDRTTKLLKLLTKAEREKVVKVVSLILANDIKGLKIKKLSGYANAYRARIGSVRIIYFEHEVHNELVFVGRRNEKTYKKF